MKVGYFCSLPRWVPESLKEMPHSLFDVTLWWSLWKELGLLCPGAFTNLLLWAGTSSPGGGLRSCILYFIFSCYETPSPRVLSLTVDGFLSCLLLSWQGPLQGCEQNWRRPLSWPPGLLLPTGEGEVKEPSRPETESFTVASSPWPA